MTQQNALEILALIALYYPREKIPDDTAKIWVKNLAGVHTHDATRAAEEITQTCRRWPSWSDFYFAAARAKSVRLSKSGPSISPSSGGPPAPKGYAKRMREYVARMAPFDPLTPSTMNQGQAIDALHQEFGCPDHQIKGEHCRPCYNQNVDLEYRMER